MELFYVLMAVVCAACSAWSAADKNIAGVIHWLAMLLIIMSKLYAFVEPIHNAAPGILI